MKFETLTDFKLIVESGYIIINNEYMNRKGGNRNFECARYNWVIVNVLKWEHT